MSTFLCLKRNSLTGFWPLLVHWKRFLFFLGESVFPFHFFVCMEFPHLKGRLSRRRKHPSIPSRSLLNHALPFGATGKGGKIFGQLFRRCLDNLPRSYFAGSNLCSSVRIFSPTWEKTVMLKVSLPSNDFDAGKTSLGHAKSCCLLGDVHHIRQFANVLRPHEARQLF